MPSQQDIPITLRRWSGVNLALDETLIDPSFLRSSNNWVPAETYLLTKRKGTAAYLDTDAGALTNTKRIHSMLRVHSGANRYLFAVRNNNDANDEVIFSTNDANFAVAGGADTFSAIGSRYGMAAFGNYIYVGNGVAGDEIKRIPFAGTAVDLAALSALVLTGASAAVVTDDTSQLPGGTYSYCWARYDSTAKKWISRGTPSVITISGTRARLEFTAPSTSIAPDKYHLFVAPVNLPIEYAHDQVIEGVDASVVVVVTDISISSTPIPSAQTIYRTGRSLKIHMNRLWVARDQANPTNVYASSILLPGMEQALFDQFDFFPSNAVIPMPEEISGISPVTIGASQQQPQSPMAICSETKTWLWFGDILDDINGYLMGLSGEAGTISQDTMVLTRVGLIMCGRDSVYLIRPDTAEVIDIGWPIAPQIRAIPRAVRADCHAAYHKGFYKLSIVPPGETTATRQWWLDLRQGLTNPPSWWGPHTCPAYTATCTTRKDVAEDDRLFGAISGGGVILLLDQDNSYQDNGSDIQSTWASQGLDDKKPFQRKLFTRIRLKGKADPDTNLQVTVFTDGGIIQEADPILLEGTLGDDWGSGDWYDAEWATSIWDEGETILDPRPRGTLGKFQLSHLGSSKVDLRDFELRYIPVGRKVE